LVQFQQQILRFALVWPSTPLILTQLGFDWKQHRLLNSLFAAVSRSVAAASTSTANGMIFYLPPLHGAALKYSASHTVHDVFPSAVLMLGSFGRH
jgi:hypothetical protein